MSASDFSAGFIPADELSTNGINFENIKFHDIDSRSPPAFLGSNVEEYGPLLVEDIDSSQLPISSQLILAPEYKNGVGFIEAIRPITRFNKESFVNILECFESANCSSVIACVSKNVLDFKSIISSLLESGFFVLNSSMSPNYLWLSTEL